MSYLTRPVRSQHLPKLSVEIVGTDPPAYFEWLEKERRKLYEMHESALERRRMLITRLYYPQNYYEKLSTSS